jgi:hypothetical protein
MDGVRSVSVDLVQKMAVIVSTASEKSLIEAITDIGTCSRIIEVTLNFCDAGDARACYRPASQLAPPSQVLFKVSYVVFVFEGYQAEPWSGPLPSFSARSSPVVPRETSSGLAAPLQERLFPPTANEEGKALRTYQIPSLVVLNYLQLPNSP